MEPKITDAIFACFLILTLKCLQIERDLNVSKDNNSIMEARHTISTKVRNILRLNNENFDQDTFTK